MYSTASVSQLAFTEKYVEACWIKQLHTIVELVLGKLRATSGFKRANQTKDMIRDMVR